MGSAVNSAPSKAKAKSKAKSATPHLAPLAAAFAVTICAFIASTIYAEYAATAIDAKTATVVDNALPSMERLTEARAALRQIEVVSDEYAYIDRDAARRRRVQQRLAAARASFDASFDAYTATPTFEGERIVATGLQPKLRDLYRALERLESRAEEHFDGADRDVVDRDFHSAIESVDDELKALGVWNEREALSAGHEIAAIRRSQLRIAVLLDGVCVLLALVAGFVALRALKSHSRLERAHTLLAGARAEELETFAQRVAHDLVSPLSALSFSLSSIRTRTPGDELAIRRANACVQRARALVQGIFEFSRAGAKPELGGSADFDDALRGVLEEIVSTASEVPELLIEPHEPFEVACSAGVLTSLLSNLLRNAVKYMGDSVQRRVTVRAIDRGSLVRIEVEDTGPGLPPGLEDSVFEPYVRAAGMTQPGLGLGLSTVRRLAQAHGGAVGVRTEPGFGSTFWFELPRLERISGRISDSSAAAE
jgi:signal transduction histidine kinase